VTTRGFGKVWAILVALAVIGLAGTIMAFGVILWWFGVLLFG